MSYLICAQEIMTSFVVPMDEGDSYRGAMTALRGQPSPFSCKYPLFPFPSWPSQYGAFQIANYQT